MAQLDIYDRYLRKLREKQKERSRYAKQIIRRAGPQYQKTEQDYQQYLSREDLPETLKASAALEQQRKWAGIVSGAVEKERISETERREVLGEKIEEVEFKRDIIQKEEDERKEREEKAGKAKLWQIAGKVGGMALGGILAGPAGVGLGGMIGSAATSAAIALDKSYPIAQRYEAMDTALQETLGGIKSVLTLDSEKKDWAEFDKLSPILQGARDEGNWDLFGAIKDAYESGMPVEQILKMFGAEAEEGE